MVILEKIGDVGTFNEKLTNLENHGFVGRRNRQSLAAALAAGSAAAHRGYVASDEDVNRVIDILENLLEAVYILEGAAEKLKRTTPKRKLKKGRQDRKQMSHPL